MTTLVPAPVRHVPPANQRLAVPWGTVLPLAVVAAVGNEFWLVVTRGTVGATDRAQEPFLAWLRESTMLLPVYMVAVLAVLTLALRWFGPRPLRARAVVMTLLLVVLASTLTAIAVQAVNAAYDYQLQAGHVATMAQHIPTCDNECVADRQQSALLLQVRALGLGGLVMLVSNLVLLGLVVAFRGGHLNVVSPRRQPLCQHTSTWADHPGATGDGAATRNEEHAGRRLTTVELCLAAGLLGTEAIHATVIGEHLDEWPAAGLSLLLLAMVELCAAGLVLERHRWAAPVTVIVSAVPLLLWLWSHTTGLPFGPTTGVSQPIGLADAMAALLAAITLALAGGLLHSRGRPRRPRPAQHQTALALVAVLAIAIIGATGGLGSILDALPPSAAGQPSTTSNGHH